MSEQSSSLLISFCVLFYFIQWQERIGKATVQQVVLFAFAFEFWQKQTQF